MSPMMLSSFSGILITCMLLTGLSQGQQAPDPLSARISCPESFASRGSHCYGLLTFEETWNTAELLCQEYPSGHLLSLLNDGETSFVAALIAQSGAGSKPFWTGLHDTSQNGKWKWSSNALYLYQAWEQNYPSNSQPGYCAVLTPESVRPIPFPDSSACLRVLDE
ncbi:lithostathine-like [Macrotis lagotis]|uniref:lithostathine-like n=1 Tax=Macrotis lagotis TaxID=92651 RepID=UPI003D6959C4